MTPLGALAVYRASLIVGQERTWNTVSRSETQGRKDALFGHAERASRGAPAKRELHGSGAHASCSRLAAPRRNR
jgi:hypothetical protein